MCQRACRVSQMWLTLAHRAASRQQQQQQQHNRRRAMSVVSVTIHEAKVGVYAYRARAAALLSWSSFSVLGALAGKRRGQRFFSLFALCTTRFEVVVVVCGQRLSHGAAMAMNCTRARHVLCLWCLRGQSVAICCSVAYICPHAQDVRSADPNGFSDPYALVFVGKNKPKKTKIVKKNLSPKWEEVRQELPILWLQTRALTCDVMLTSCALADVRLPADAPRHDTASASVGLGRCWLR